MRSPLLHLQVTQGSSVVVTDLSAVTFCPFTKHPAKCNKIKHSRLLILSLYIRVLLFGSGMYILIFIFIRNMSSHNVERYDIRKGHSCKIASFYDDIIVKTLSLQSYVTQKRREKRRGGNQKRRKRPLQRTHYRQFVFRRVEAAL